MTKKYKSAPPDSFRELVYKNETDGRWYFKDIIENKRRNIHKPIGFTDGCGFVKIDGKQFYDYRLIYWLETGNNPTIIKFKDEKKGNYFSNMIDSSQVGSTKQDSDNNIRCSKTKTKGDRYQARIKFEGKTYSAGTYNTEIEARLASLKVRSLLFPDQKDILHKELTTTAKRYVMGKQI